MVMSRVHKVLGLHQHKHTGKKMPHANTSYGALFVLLLFPVIMLSLLANIVMASNHNIKVSASILAPLPLDPPTLKTSESSPTTRSSTNVSGTCPVTVPAVIIVIYNNGRQVGSTFCSTGGTYYLSLPLTIGHNKLQATVVNITHQVGSSSPVVDLVRHPITDNQIDNIFDLVSLEPFYIMSPDGHVKWRGEIIGGQAPYEITIDWGDGVKDTAHVGQASVIEYSHVYKSPHSYSVRITAKDSDGQVVSIYTSMTALTTRSDKFGFLSLDMTTTNQPIINFIESYLIQIYIVTIFALILLWYLDRYKPVLGVKHRLGRQKH